MIEVVCAVVMSDDMFLICQRSELMKLPLKWEFPGGKIEANETEQDALVRELIEELSITVKPVKKLTAVNYKYPEFEITLIPYLCEYISGDIVLDEHKSYKWCTKDDFLLYEFADADKPIIEEIKELWS